MCTPSYELSFGGAGGGHLMDKPFLKVYSPENQRNGPMFVSKAYPLNATSWSFGRLLAYIWTKEGHFYRTENKTFDKRLNCICNILHTCNQIIHWKMFPVEDFDPRMVTTKETPDLEIKRR